MDERNEDYKAIWHFGQPPKDGTKILAVANESIGFVSYQTDRYGHKGWVNEHHTKWIGDMDPIVWAELVPIDDETK